MNTAQEFAARVGPQVLVGARDVNRSRRDERDQHVLVDREFRFAVAIFAKVVAIPLREGRVQLADGFAKVAARQRCATGARVVREDYGEAWIGGGGPQRSLAHARMAGDADAFGVDGGICLQITEYTA